MLFHTTGCVVHHMKTLENEWYIAIMAYKYKLAVLQILRDFLHYHILRVHVIPTYRVYQLNDIKN